MAVQAIVPAQTDIITPQDATPRAWERRPEEDTLWYDRFSLYRDLGVTRSIAGAYRQWRQLTDDADTADGRDYQRMNYAPVSWYDYAETYDWKERAALYDDHVRAMWSDDSVLELARRRRVMLLAQIADGYAAELTQRDTATMPVNQVSQTMKTAIRELREETGVGRSSVQFNVLLDQLPPDLQKTLAELLK